MKKRLLESAIVALVTVQPLVAQKFYSDDPLQNEPRPRNAGTIRVRRLNDYYDLLQNTFQQKGERNRNHTIIPAGAVNTLGEPMEGAWYTQRHYWKPMSEEELMRGPGGSSPPAADGPWTVVSAKSEGLAPGFVMKDSKGDRYFVKFDPMTNPEMATGAEMICARFFYALGYHVPDYYLIYFTRERLELARDVEFRDAQGRKRKMTPHDLETLLAKVPKTNNGENRGIASLELPGKPIGPFRYYGTRSDDPNDIVPHEHRRELRGLYVFSAWLGHNDARAINTLDALVDEQDGRRYVRHYLIDFGSALGSLTDQPKTVRYGGEYYLDFKAAPKQILTLGAAVPYWARASYPDYPSVGRFEAARFEPDKWLPDYPNAAFLNRLPDDEFWAAKQVMAFTNDQIRAIVKVARFSDPEAERYLADTLIARRYKMGKVFFAKVLPLDRFEVKDSQLVFRDLAQEHGFEVRGTLQVAWSRFENDTGKKEPISTTGFHLPKAGLPDSMPTYLAADIWRGDEKTKTVTVYLRVAGTQAEVVGVDRTW